MPKKICNFRGCNAIINRSEKYCPAHKIQVEADRKERHKRYDQKHRDPEAVAFYNSSAWKTVKEVVLFRDHYLCQHCLKDNIMTPADLVHHIIELKDDWSKRLDKDNLISLCTACHNKEHNGNKRRG